MDVLFKNSLFILICQEGFDLFPINRDASILIPDVKSGFRFAQYLVE